MKTNELENEAQANEQNDGESTEQSSLSAAEAQSQLPDLEPHDEVKGGQTREHILLARQVG